MNFGRRTPESEARALVSCAYALGLREFDTANAYSDGEAERIVGTATRGLDGVRLTTKAGVWRREGLSRQALRAAVAGSRERLGVAALDRLLLHAPDPLTPIEETLDELGLLLESGAIRSWGVSNFAAWQVGDVRHRCAARGLPGPATSQVLYNLAVRQLEIEYFAFARAAGLETAVYNPLAGGLLRDPAQPRMATSRLESNRLYKERYGSARLRDFALSCAAIAHEAGLTLDQLAIAWVVSRPGVDVVVLGPASVEQLERSVAAAKLTLSQETTRALEEAHLGLVGTRVSYAR